MAAPEPGGRKAAPLDLVERRIPVPEAIAAVQRFPWDCDEELVELEREHVLLVLDDFIRGSIGPSDVEDWSEALSGRDDVGMTDPEVQQALFELSAPELFEPMAEAAAAWARRLRG